MVPKRRMPSRPLLGAGGVGRLLEHDGETSLLGQQPLEEVLVVPTGRRPPLASKGVLEGGAWQDETVARVPAHQPKSVARRLIRESAVLRVYVRGSGVSWRRHAVAGPPGPGVR